MTLDGLLGLLEAAPFAKAIREGSLLFPWIESVHVLAIVTVVGMVAVMDLALLGLASPTSSLRTLVRDANAITWIAFGLAVITGFLLFASSATGYAKNPAFLIKFALMAVAGANMAIFHLVAAPAAFAQGGEAGPPASARIAGLISISCWIGIVVAGRWIGFLAN